MGDRNLSKGCSLCIEGKKGVIYITGLCKAGCFFCPVPFEWRKEEDMKYNGQPIKDINEIPSLIDTSITKGVSITGGDPVLAVDKTCKVIRLLKDKFGKDFHIHVYTNNLHDNDLDAFKQLDETELDELRIHITNGDCSLLHKLIKHNFELVVEIPCIPKEFGYYAKLVNELEQLGIKHLNLNQFEFSFGVNEKAMEERGFERAEKKHLVKGSEEMAHKIIKYVDENNLNLKINYCSSERKESIGKDVEV